VIKIVAQTSITYKFLSSYYSHMYLATSKIWIHKYYCRPTAFCSKNYAN